MNKTPTRKLSLCRTTVRTATVLPPEALQQAVGGKQALCSCDAHCDIVWSRRVCW
jgi:hypothetical protein